MRGGGAHAWAAAAAKSSVGGAWSLIWSALLMSAHHSLVDPAQPRVLLAGEVDAHVRHQFERLGVPALSVDPCPSADPRGLHYVGLAHEVMYSRSWELIIGFLPCTATA